MDRVLKLFCAIFCVAILFTPAALFADEPGVFGQVVETADETMPDGLLKLIAIIVLGARGLRLALSWFGIDPEKGTIGDYIFVIVELLAAHLPERKAT